MDYKDLIKKEFTPEFTESEIKEAFEDAVNTNNFRKICRYYTDKHRNKTIVKVEKNSKAYSVDWSIKNFPAFYEYIFEYAKKSQNISSSFHLLATRSTWSLKKLKNIHLFEKLPLAEQQDLEKTKKGFSCGTCSQYHKRFVDFALDNYNTNYKVYDFSCGWGQRLLGALLRNIEYYGTDPNTELVKDLNRLADDYKKVHGTTTKVDIKNTGSEVFHPEWVNTVGLAFSSPPYFDLEGYFSAGQSIINYPKFSDWVTKYVKPTCENIEKYLVKGGYMVVNVTNSFVVDEDIEKAWTDEAKAAGLTYVDTKEVESTKLKGKVKKEKFFIFKKV